MTTTNDERQLERVNEIANNAYQYMDEHDITTFVRGGKCITWEPDYATLTIVDMNTGDMLLNATRDGDGWIDQGNNLSPDMVAEFNRLNHPQEIAPPRSAQPEL